MKNKYLKLINYKILSLLSIILVGIYLSFIGGYGSDEDTLALIGAFESMMGGERVMASRFTPYPVAEIGIGFLSYQFGSFAANFVTFLSYLLISKKLWVIIKYLFIKNLACKNSIYKTKILQFGFLFTILIVFLMKE